MQDRSINHIRRHLLDWYGRSRRDLPWRRTRDPYAIWLSEIMLQQTTVRTVEPRWRRFLERFPTVVALADAPLDDVVNEWSGLGYYARARNLHAAAQRITTDFNGKIPDSFELLLALPGMGRYTAAAVASIAFGEDVAVVDANVERVVARLDAIREDVRSASVKKRIWDRAQELLPKRKAGDWNQAMMELGAVVCLPRAPQCSLCPIKTYCRAYELETPEAFPVKEPKAAMESIREVTVILQQVDRVLVLQRPQQVSFGGMWELPRGQAFDEEHSREAVTRIVLEQTCMAVKPKSHIMRIKHVVMRRNILLNVWTAETNAKKVIPKSHEQFRWVTPEEWLTLPISTTQKKIASRLLEGNEH